MKSKRRLLICLLSVAVLIVIAAAMMVIGRGHTIYVDNRSVEYNGQTYETPYKVTVYVKNEQIAKLYDSERGMSTWIGQNFKMTLEVMEEKGGDEVLQTIQLNLPYSMDGIIVNIPAVLAGLPEEAWLTEFIPTPTKEEDEEEVPGEGDEFGMTDDMGLGGDI
ncbi:MAG: hypothetical protein HFF89_08790 [Oscillibacter sp.]|nr:hypothetical protein [Oscillibacter sp.]MCI8847725.1 hypothetical protein [Oscillibacter sp.]MCI9375443.1 hypothetical protein [Oscillibacter sp.]